MIDFLFICSANQMRSPTAEHVARLAGFNASSAGTHIGRSTTIRRITRYELERADKIICMQEEHATTVRQIFPEFSGRIEVWNIPDDYEYCDPELIRIIRQNLGLVKTAVIHSDSLEDKVRSIEASMEKGNCG